MNGHVLLLLLFRCNIVNNSFDRIQIDRGYERQPESLDHNIDIQLQSDPILFHDDWAST
jgi:hypothetical protein